MNILTTNRLKEVTPISDAIDVGMLTPFIDIAETFHVRPVMTDELYQEIVYAIEQGTLSEPMNSFVDDYVVPCIAYYSWYEASPTLWLKTENKGLVTKFSDNSNAIDANAFKIYRQSIYDKALMYRNRLERYLVEGNVSGYAKSCTTNKGNSTGFFLGF